MTEIDTSKPNPAFDEWLAENVMGWRLVCISTESHTGYTSAWHWLDADNHDHGTRDSWRPTVSIAAAMEIIKKRFSDSFDDEYALGMSYVFDPEDGLGWWRVWFAGGKRWKAAEDEAYELPLAISKAAHAALSKAD